MKKKISTWCDKLIYSLLFIFFAMVMLITLELLFGLFSGEMPIWMRYVLEQHGGV